MTPAARLTIVEATDGLQLPALHFAPGKPTKRAIIWLHGMGPGGIFYPVTFTNALAASFTERGIAMLGLQNRGGGMLQGIRYTDGTGEKQKRLQGTTHELIRECVQDIDGAVAWAYAQGYTELILGGHSTGANKVAIYSYLKPRNKIQSYILFGGGDDTGLAYESMGPERFRHALAESKRHVAAGNGEALAPYDWLDGYFSYQSAADILDPDGDYNVFPFYETQNGRIGTKELWREYKSVARPTLVIYGAEDEYCRPDVNSCLKTLEEAAPDGADITFKTAPGDHSCYQHERELAEAVAGWSARHLPA
jgi:predicted esterase